LGRLKRLVCDALYFISLINHQVEGRVVVVFSSFLTEINIAGQFAEKQNIRSDQNLGFDTRRFKQLVKEFYRAQVGIQAKFFSYF